MKTIAILFVLTSHSLIGDMGTPSAKPTGVWLEELTTPYYAFIDAGYQVDIASTNGGIIPIDPNSTATQPLPDSVIRYQDDNTLKTTIQNSLTLDSVDMNKYQVVFIPGGHGTMYDLPNNTKLASIVSDTIARGHIVGAVCHGPAGLLSARKANGEPLVKGYRVAAFTNAEEEAVGMVEEMPFSLEDQLKAKGAIYEHGAIWLPYAVSDRGLITGQNPASSGLVADLIIKELKKKQ